MRRFLFRLYTSHPKEKIQPPQSTVLSLAPRNRSIPQIPSNNLTSLSALLVDKLRTKHLDFDMQWTYGSFLDDVPKRLEHSEALAAATNALMSAHPRTADPSFSISQQQMQSYVAALQATRLALLRPSEAHSTNTMCAIYFLWVCQVNIQSMSGSFELENVLTSTATGRHPW